MKTLSVSRNRLGWSQRHLAHKAGIAYKSLQLIEGGNHNPGLATLSKMAFAMGYGVKTFQNFTESFFQKSPHSLYILSKRMMNEKKDWMTLFFDFVDHFRFSQNVSLVSEAPDTDLEIEKRALLSSTVETLCDEMRLSTPEWTMSVPPLDKPWFVAEVENLKSFSLMESPIHFRKRKIFVLENFLRRV